MALVHGFQDESGMHQHVRTVSALENAELIRDVT